MPVSICVEWIKYHFGLGLMLIDFLTEYEREKRFYIFVSSDLDQIIMCNILRLQICSPGNS